MAKARYEVSTFEGRFRLTVALGAKLGWARAEILGLTVAEANQAMDELAQAAQEWQMLLAQAYHAPDTVVDAYKEKTEERKGLQDLMREVDPERAKDLEVKQAALEFLAKLKEEGHGGRE